MHLTFQNGQNKGVDKYQHKYNAHMLRKKSQYPKYNLLYALYVFNEFVGLCYSLHDSTCDYNVYY